MADNPSTSHQDPSSSQNPGRAHGDPYRESQTRSEDELRRLGRESGEAARATAERLQGQGRRALSEGRQRAREFQHDLEDLVAQRPKTALAIAACAGVVIGLLCTRGRS